jgi:competence protein ComEC
VVSPLPVGRVPGPLDVRLVPALVLTMATCLAVPVLPYELVLVFPWALGAAAVTSSMLLVVVARGGRAAMAAVTALTACALWIAAVAAVQAVGDRVPVEASGWEDAVAAGQPVRLSGEATGPAVRSVGSFGERWHLPVVIAGFGHPMREVPGGVEVVVSGGAEWDGVEPGTQVCLTAELEASGTAVFARARTGADAGSCPELDGEPGEGNGTARTTGREVVRAAVRQAAAGSVGAAPQLLPGLVLGDRSLQDPQLDEAMKAAGLSHLSAVSGDNFVKGYSRSNPVNRWVYPGICPFTIQLRLWTRRLKTRSTPPASLVTSTALLLAREPCVVVILEHAGIWVCSERVGDDVSEPLDGR